MKVFQRDPVFFNHVILAKNELVGIEAGPRIQVCGLIKKLKEADAYRIIRYRRLKEKESKGIIKSVSKLIGVPYGVPRLILQLFDQIFSTNFFTKLLSDKMCQVCSSIVAWAFYVRCHVRFNYVPWQSCDPDDIDDECERNPKLWEVIDQKGDL